EKWAVVPGESRQHPVLDRSRDVTESVDEDQSTDRYPRSTVIHGIERVRDSETRTEHENRVSIDGWVFLELFQERTKPLACRMQRAAEFWPAPEDLAGGPFPLFLLVRII